MKVSWQWKLWLINGFCQGYFLLFTAVTLKVGFSTTLPFLLRDDPQSLFCLKALAIFVCFNMTANYICIRYTAKYSHFKSSKKKEYWCNPDGKKSLLNDFGNVNNNSTASHSLPSISESKHLAMENNGNVLNGNAVDINIGGWTYCKDCADLVPPRTKHCPLCNSCILKRDHHCFFAGCCVGFHNQRYFAIFCLYAAAGGIFSSLVTHYYLCYHYEGVQAWGVISYLLPSLMWFWMMGMESASGFVFIMILFLYWNCVTSVICLYYFGLQVVFISRGQTKYECMKGIRSYKGTIWLNIKSVFGKFWFVGFLLPAPFLGYFGDGKNWDDFVPSKVQ